MTLLFLDSYLCNLSHSYCQSERGTVDRGVHRVGLRFSIGKLDIKGGTLFYARNSHSRTEGVETSKMGSPYGERVG